MVDITSKNLNIQLSAKENITSSLTSENLHIIICDCEKTEIKQALCYIKSGQQDINTYVNEVVIPTLDTYEQTAENQMQNCMEQVRQYADEITEHNYATTTELNSALSTKQDVLSDLSTIRSGAALGATAVQPADLATVATTGSYNDLDNKPTIPTVPTNVSSFTNDSGYITSSALSPYALSADIPTFTSDLTNDSGYITASDLPTVNNATLTITQDNVSKGTFTANASSNTTVNIDLTGKADIDLSNLNNSGKIKSSNLSMPSDTFDDLTLGASGTSYTAPSNGWYFFYKAGNGAGQYLAVYNKGANSTDKFVHIDYALSGNEQITCLIPVKKGDRVEFHYTLGGQTYLFRFIYAVGSESEAN